MESNLDLDSSTNNQTGTYLLQGKKLQNHGGNLTLTILDVQRTAAAAMGHPRPLSLQDR